MLDDERKEMTRMHIFSKCREREREGEGERESGGVCVSEEYFRAGRVILTITPHPHGEALLETAVLAPVPVVLSDLTVFVAAALVAQLLADRALEEPLAALAAYGAVVPS